MWGTMGPHCLLCLRVTLHRLGYPTTAQFSSRFRSVPLVREPQRGDVLVTPATMN